MRLFKIFILIFLAPSLVFAEDTSRISDQVIPLQTDIIPNRPAPILELGDSFLNTGKLNSGFELPTGAVWQPSLIVWGTYRTAVQTIDDGKESTTEWSNRFDLFANLYLTNTERILIGLRPLDKSGRFTRYTFEAIDSEIEEEGEFEEEFNSNITTLFFEGDFGELFPFLDKEDRYGLDFGIAVGRQPISFQDGILINDTIDALGISKINLKPGFGINLRTTALWAWDELNRTNLDNEDNKATLYGLFNEIDFSLSTVELDFVYVDSDDLTDDGFYAGLGSTQRLGEFSTTFRVLGSQAVNEETEHSSDGLLLFAEFGRTPYSSHDYFYTNLFYGIDRYRSASRGPTLGGPLSPAGVLFASVGLGRYQAALDSYADDAFGGAMGYQIFSNDLRKQLLFELAGRYTTEDIGQRAAALGLSYQMALGRRSVLRADAYGRYGAERDGTPELDDNEFGYGARLEWMFRL